MGGVILPLPPKIPGPEHHGPMIALTAHFFLVSPVADVHPHGGHAPPSRGAGVDVSVAHAGSPVLHGLASVGAGPLGPQGLQQRSLANACHANYHQLHPGIGTGVFQDALQDKLRKLFFLLIVTFWKFNIFPSH